MVYAALAGWAAGRLGVWWCMESMDCVCSVCSGVRDRRVWLVTSVVVVYQNTVVKKPHPLHPFVITP